MSGNDEKGTTMAQLGLLVRFELKPGTGDAFDALMRTTVDGIREHEPRTLVYAVHRVEDEPDVRVFYELYTGPDALDEHEAQPTTRLFLDSWGEYVATVTVQRLSPVAVHGRELGVG